MWRSGCSLPGCQGDLKIIIILKDCRSKASFCGRRSYSPAALHCTEWRWGQVGEWVMKTVLGWGGATSKVSAAPPASVSWPVWSFQRQKKNNKKQRQKVSEATTVPTSCHCFQISCRSYKASVCAQTVPRHNKGALTVSSWTETTLIEAKVSLKHLLSRKLKLNMTYHFKISYHDNISI